MNLKEAFRYQNKLEGLLEDAQRVITYSDAGFIVTKTHHISAADKDAEDKIEVVEKESEYKVDDVITCINSLLIEKGKVATAAFMAKTNLDFCLDAAIVSNKSTQTACRYIRNMLEKVRETKTKTQGTGYKFNAEGNQAPYYYDIDVVKTEDFNRENIKSIMRSMIDSADKVSAKIDEAMVTTHVDFEPLFDMNDTFDDIMERFVTDKE